MPSLTARLGNVIRGHPTRNGSHRLVFSAQLPTESLQLGRKRPVSSFSWLSGYAFCLIRRGNGATPRFLSQVLGGELPRIAVHGPRQLGSLRIAHDFLRRWIELHRPT